MRQRGHTRGEPPTLKREDRPSRAKNPYELVSCRGCDRRLVADLYRVHRTPEAANERVHQVVDPNGPKLTVFCSCDHYTVFTRWRTSTPAP